MNPDYQAYRANKIESGQLYQDFVVDCCWNLLGLAVVQYTSRVYQQLVGESKTGVEIKHDENYAKSTNLYIEIAEKAQPRAGAFAPSGIYRSDNTWLYVIGDYNTIFIFPKTLLRALHKANRYRELTIRTGTSQGYLLPHADAVKYAAQILYPQAADKIGKEVRDLMALGRELYQLVSRPPGKQLDLCFAESPGSVGG